MNLSKPPANYNMLTNAETDTDMKMPCPNCSTTVVLHDGWAGKQVECPACHGLFSVPAPDSAASTIAEDPVQTDPVPRSLLPHDEISGRPLPIQYEKGAAPSEADVASRSAPQQSHDGASRGGLLYIDIGRDEVGFEEGLRKILPLYLAS